MEAKPGVIDRSNSYVARNEILALGNRARSQSSGAARTQRPASLSGSSSLAGSTLSGGGSSSTNLSSLPSTLHSTSITPTHTLLLQGAVFQDSSEYAMIEFQRLLHSLPTLEVFNAAKSNITGRIFYKGRTFQVQEPEKEHVSVEAVQSYATPTVAMMNGNTTAGSTAMMNTNGTFGSTNGNTTGNTDAASTTKSIVRDDHPPLIIGVRIEDDEEDDEDASHDGEDEDEGQTNDDGSDATSESDDDTRHTEGVTDTQRQRRRRRRRRHAQPEIIDLDQTPLSVLLQRQSSNPQINGSLSTSPHHAGSSNSSALIPQTHNYYFYVRTLFNSDDDTFLRYYVKLNWLRRMNWIDMSGTSISGYGVVSLIASCCSNIQCLFLSECSQMDNNAIYAIVNLCTSLKQLDISNCPNVTRFGLLYLAEFQLHVVQNSLEIIDVSHCGGNDMIAQNAALQQQSSSLPATLLASSSSSASSHRPPPASSSPFSGQFVSLALFNALEERGFRGRFVYAHQPKREELIGDPQIIKVPIPQQHHQPPPQPQQYNNNLSANSNTLPPSLGLGLTPQNSITSSASTSDQSHQSPPSPQYTYQLSSPFFQHYQQMSHRIIDLAMRDITSQVITELSWDWIKAQDRIRMERLRTHRLQLGLTPNLPPSSSPNNSGGGGGGFVHEIETDMHLAARNNPTAAPSHLPLTPHFYSLNLSGHLINDRLLFYILINWGPRLYSLILDGTYITSVGMKELIHCPYLHILSFNSCLNIIDKTKANSILKDSLRSMIYLSELNLTNSRLSGRMMSSHPNLKLDILIANGCPISSFAIRMLSSSSGSAGGGAVGGDTQNMCKYSLRLLSLSNCSFVNRKSLEYIFKFQYLQLIDVSECRGLKREDIVDGFIQTAENEIQKMEALVMGKRQSGGKQSVASLQQQSTFGCMLCHLKHIICYGIGSSFSEKRAAEFARELNTLATKLQQLLLLHYHQVQVAEQAAMSGSIVGGSNLQSNLSAIDSNLAPPIIRQTPPPPPAYLRREFSRDPIAVIATRTSPVLQRYQPTLTRFVTQQQHAPNGAVVPVVVAIPSGLQIGAPGIVDHSIAASAAPPLFRGASLLDECPYSFLPTMIPPTPISSGNTNSTVSAPSGLGSRGTSRNDLASIPRPSQAPQVSHPPPPALHQSSSYMMMLNEHAGGGTPTTLTPGGVPTPSNTSTSTSTPTLFRSPPPPAHVPLSTAPAGGELYFSMTPDLIAMAQQQQQRYSSTSSTRDTPPPPIEGFSGLSLGSSALPYAAVYSAPIPTLDVVATPGSFAPLNTSSNTTHTQMPASTLNTSFANVATAATTTVTGTNTSSSASFVGSNTLSPTLILPSQLPISFAPSSTTAGQSAPFVSPFAALANTARPTPSSALPSQLSFPPAFGAPSFPSPFGGAPITSTPISHSAMPAPVLPVMPAILNPPVASVSASIGVESRGNSEGVEGGGESSSNNKSSSSYIEGELTLLNAPSISSSSLLVVSPSLMPGEPSPMQPGGK